MADAVVGSKEVAVIFLGFVLGKVLDVTGIAFPLTPDQIYQATLAAAGIIRIFWTSGKIQSFLPKNSQ